MEPIEGVKPIPQEAESKFNPTETQQAIELTFQSLKTIATKIYSKDSLIFSNGTHAEDQRRARHEKGEKFPFIFDTDFKSGHELGGTGGRIDFDPDEEQPEFDDISFRWYDQADGAETDASLGHFTDPVTLKDKIVPNYNIKVSKKDDPLDHAGEVIHRIEFRDQRRREWKIMDGKLQVTSETIPSAEEWEKSEEKAIFDKFTASLEQYNLTLPEPKVGLIGRLFRRGS